MSFQRITGSASRAQRVGVYTVFVVLLSVLLVSGGIAAIGVSDSSGPGIALAQSEDEEDGRTSGVTVPASGSDSEENETSDDGGDGAAAGDGSGDGDPSAMEEREASATGNTTEGVNDADENRSATEERADSEVPAGENETGSERSGVDEYEDEDDGIGFVAQRFLDMVSGVTTQIQNEVGGIGSMMLEYSVTRSAPGVADDPSTWDSPDEGKWIGAVEIMSLTRLIGIMFSLAMVGWAIATYPVSTTKSKKTLIMAVPVGIFLAKPSFWTGLTLHGSTTYSTTITPSPEMLATPEGMLAVGLGVILAGVLAASSMWVFVLATIVTVVAHEAGVVTTSLLPLAASFLLGPMYLKSVGQSVVYLHGVTVVMPFFQALGNLAVVRMFFTHSGVLGSLGGVLALLGVVYMLHYKFQREMLEKAFSAPFVSLGVDGARQTIEGIENIGKAPQRMRDIRSSIQEGISGARSKFTGSDGSGGGGGSGSSWRPDIGEVQTPSVSSGRPSGTAVADGGSDADASYPHAGTSGTPDAESWGTRPVARDESGRFASIDSVTENRERDRLASGDY